MAPQTTLIVKIEPESKQLFSEFVDAVKALNRTGDDTMIAAAARRLVNAHRVDEKRADDWVLVPGALVHELQGVLGDG